MLPALIFAFQLLANASEVAVAEDFNDLGKLLLGGFVAAVAVALAFTFVRLRLRDRRPAGSQFVSINANATRDEE